jgi:hypothetical protein
MLAPRSVSSRPGLECPETGGPWLLHCLPDGRPDRPQDRLPGGQSPAGRGARRTRAAHRLRLAASLLAVAGLLGCQHPPSAAPAAPTLSLPLPPAAPPPAPAVPAEASVWRFSTGPDSCTGQALGHDATFSVRLWRGHGTTFVLAARPRPGSPALSGFAQLRFQGPAGGWSAFARVGPGPVAATSLPLTDRAVGRVALLLSGGTLTPIGVGTAMPALRLPPAGAAGRAWFACARGMLY